MRNGSSRGPSITSYRNATTLMAMSTHVATGLMWLGWSSRSGNMVRAYSRRGVAGRAGSSASASSVPARLPKSPMHK